MGMVDLLRSMLAVPDERGNPSSARFRMAARRKARSILRGSDLPVLDVAGREGLLLDPRVSPLASGATVLDLESTPLAEARRWYNGLGTFVCGDLTRLPFRDGSFGASVCVGTFYNLPDERMVREGLREMARVTRPGGTVIVEFRNADNPYMRIAAAHAGQYDASLGGLPIRAYSPGMIRGMIESAGLRIRKIHGAAFPFGRLALMHLVEATPE